jgi:hypothetical protein
MHGVERMTKPNQKDAELLINLYATGITPEMRKAMPWVMKHEKQEYDAFIEKNPIGSEGWNNFVSIAAFYELVGVLVKYETINEDVVLDYFALMWDKLGPLVKGSRKDIGSLRLFENYEYLAERKAEWVKDHPPLYKE